MKLLNIKTPVTRNFIPQILLNVQDIYFHKVGYTSYDKASWDLRQSIALPNRSDRVDAPSFYLRTETDPVFETFCF
jgi:hypothetical protein